MADIRINQLPEEIAPVATENVPIDGASTRRTTIQAFVNAGAPIASQAEAEAGVNAIKRMTPLTTKQSIASEIGVSIASAAQGALADTALQPDDIGTTAGTVAAGDDSRIVGALQPSSGLPRYLTRAAAIAATVAAPVLSIAVQHGGMVLDYVRDATGTALTTADGGTWSPAGVPTPQHWGALGDNVQDDTTYIQAAIDWATTNSGTVITDKVNLALRSVCLPSGKYRTSAAIVVKEGVEFYGEGQSNSILLPTHAGVGIDMGGTDREYSNIVVRNLGILGSYTGTLSFGLWTPSLTEGIRARKCLRGCGIYDTMVGRCQINYRVDDSYQFAIERNYGIYATLNNLRANNLTASRIIGNRFDWAEQNGIYIDGSVVASDETIALNIKYNAIQICWRNGILLYDTQMVVVEGNFFEANYRLASSDSTHDYADVNIASGPNSRGLMFVVNDNFFTGGSSPSFDSYTAIRCDRAKVLSVRGNTCRDTRYWRFVDADNANVEVFDVGANTLTATLNNRVAHSSSTAKGMIADGSDGVGTYRIFDLITGRRRETATVSGSNQTTDGRRSLYLLDCSAGNRQVALRDDECLVGTVIRLQKTDGGANSIIAVRAAGSTKTINGAASVSKTAAYAGMTITSDGTNWFVAM